MSANTGKTLFLLYLLLYRLERRLPTAVQFNPDEFILFDEEGASVGHCSGLNAFEIPSDCWALCDSNSTTPSPCTAFRKAGVRIILTSSPRPAMSKGWIEECRAEIIVMDLPTLREVSAMA